jgi:hypothetical protein
MHALWSGQAHLACRCADEGVWEEAFPGQAAAQAAAAVLEHIAPLFPAIAEHILAAQPQTARSRAQAGPGQQLQGSCGAPAERLLLCLAARTLRAEAAGAGARAVAQLPRFLCTPLLWDRCGALLLCSDKVSAQVCGDRGCLSTFIASHVFQQSNLQADN